MSEASRKPLGRSRRTLSVPYCVVPCPRSVVPAAGSDRSTRRGSRALSVGPSVPAPQSPVRLSPGISIQELFHATSKANDAHKRCGSGGCMTTAVLPPHRRTGPGNAGMGERGASAPCLLSAVVNGGRAPRSPIPPRSPRILGQGLTPPARRELRQGARRPPLARKHARGQPGASRSARPS